MPLVSIIFAYVYNAICSEFFPPFEHFFPGRDGFVDVEIHGFQKPKVKS